MRRSIAVYTVSVTMRESADIRQLSDVDVVRGAAARDRRRQNRRIGERCAAYRLCALENNVTSRIACQQLHRGCNSRHNRNP